MTIEQGARALGNAPARPASALAGNGPKHSPRDELAYPTHVLGDWRAADGSLVHIRPVTAADGGRIAGFVRSLSAETRYLRFMAAVNELAPRMIDRLTRIDHRRDAALLALARDGDRSRLVGVARYSVNDEGESVEFALVVADDWQRRGLGRRLMAGLVDTAAARGFKYIDGDVLAINRAMLAFVNALGFTTRIADDDRTVRRVRLHIARHRAGSRPGSARVMA
jgi:acetyltransferase